MVILGSWIGFAAATVGLIGVWFIKGAGAMASLSGFLPYSTAASFSFSVIPLFILMGYFAFHAGLTGDLFKTARQWFGHMPGGLAIATTFAAAGFGACTGSSTAAAAVMGKVAIPEMTRYKYDPTLTAGAVAASGTMASMIPPSVIIVIYGVLTEQSIGTLLIAGFLPGISEALLYSGMIYFRCLLNPKLGAALPAASWRARFVSLKGTGGMLLLIVIILGGIYGGVFTPTEAGGIGAFGALLMAFFSGKLTWTVVRNSLLDTAKTTAMIFATLIGVLIFLRFLALSGVTTAFTSAMLALPWPPLAILFVVLGIYVFLGMFVSATGMLMLTLPLVFPVITGLGYDPIWFGIIAVRMCEVAFITPPVGMNVYAVKSVVPELAVEDIFKGTFWFLAMDIINIMLLIAFPAIALWLPSTMQLN